MKPRRVELYLETETSVKLSDLRNARAYIVKVVPRGDQEKIVKVIEARANVIRK